MPDFANALRATTTRRVDPAGTMGEVNRALLELVACFVISEKPGDGSFDGILIQPLLRPSVVAPPSDPEPTGGLRARAFLQSVRATRLGQLAYRVATDQARACQPRPKGQLR